MKSKRFAIVPPLSVDNVSGCRDILFHLCAMNAEKQPPAVTPLPRANILVVDDEESLLDVVNSMLTDAGYTVHTAANPKEALAWLKTANWKIDLIVSDVLMPEMDGLSFLRIVRQHSKEVALLLISAFVVAEDLWGEHSQVPFLAKPFRQHELVQAVENCLTQFRGSHPPF